MPTATYDVDALETSAKDRVRLMIGDTDTGDTGTAVLRPMLYDSEIAREIARTHATNAPSSADTLAAVRCCRRILARAKNEVDTSGAGVTASRSQRFNQIRDTLRELEVEAFSQCRIIRKGSSRSAAEALRADPDFRQPPFEIGQDDKTS